LERLVFQASILGFGVMRLPMTEEKKVDMDKSIPLLQRALTWGLPTSIPLIGMAVGIVKWHWAGDKAYEPQQGVYHHQNPC